MTNKSAFYFITVLFIIFSLFSPKQIVVNAQDSVNKSVYDYYENQNTEEKTEENLKETNEVNKVEDNTNATVGVTFFDIIRTIFVLVIVIGLLIALLKWMQKKSNLPYSGNLVKNLGGAPLGGNRSVQVIQAGNSILIVGVGENIQLLKEVTDEKEISDILQQYNDRMDQMVNTKNLYSKIKDFLEKKGTANETEEQHSFKDEITKRIKEIELKRKEAMEEHIKKGSKDK